VDKPNHWGTFIQARKKKWGEKVTANFAVTHKERNIGQRGDYLDKIAT